jgi:hypothetical protein
LNYFRKKSINLRSSKEAKTKAGPGRARNRPKLLYSIRGDDIDDADLRQPIDRRAERFRDLLSKSSLPNRRSGRLLRFIRA